MSQPRAEYPRPQFVRSQWVNLNGEWEFEIDRSDSGLERGLRERGLERRIVVPFAPETELSGIADVDFMEAVWYRTTVTIPADWDGQDAVLHFQAIDHDATVWVNGIEVVRHRGGFTPFSANLRQVAKPGEEATIVVRARDTHRGPQARGKQSQLYANHSCLYTRTTGIWQTVWLEAVPPVHLRRPRITPDVAGASFHLEVPVSANQPGHTVRATLKDADGEVATATVRAGLDLAPRLTLQVPIDRVRLWDTTDPHLYDVRLELIDAEGNVLDEADSYAGLRSVSINGKAILINGKHVFQRLVLDQGYWPESLMTAPSEAAIVRDIELSLAAGFNGARLHQKVFEERFLYHADRLGYLVWGEFGDWGSSVGDTGDNNQQPTASYVGQWLEAVERDYSHPSIIGWCPLNETHQLLHDRITQLDDVTRAMFLATKAADTSRPVLDSSGYSHRVPETDVWDSHNYEQDPVEFAKQMADLVDDKPYGNTRDDQALSLAYDGQPYFCSEFGGIWWNAAKAAAGKSGNSADSWGYGQRVANEEDFYVRFAGLVDALLDNELMFGYCYTQLTDVFQEENGIYNFDRGNKLDVPRIKAIQERQAAYEKD
ncbi:glycoside hydrolase family 2 TIM barrel-domain containing protein [Kribbella solani]|uniref:glycoside hydrolase family 2 protein n=1 Tax=Kribbella solani TaxID=236067 RepID=UPI0029A0D87B|nr:sugar-binding domain-containing protein [Kribbella solani]MDX3003718.1 glycoside hydrolase family 2 TIM barrel-domain containing protein [Kribbella solani]